MRALLVTTAMLCLVSPGTASAQTLGAGAAIAMKRFSGEPGTSVLDTTSGGFTITAAAPITPRTGVHFEIGFDRPSTVTKRTAIQQGQLETEYRSEMRTVSVLGSAHPVARRRIRAAVLGGLTLVHFRRTVTLRPPAPAGGTSVGPPPSVFVDRVGAATVGGDLELFVSPHVAIVPAVRVHAFRLASDLGGLSIRPSVGVRWVF